MKSKTVQHTPTPWKLMSDEIEITGKFLEIRNSQNVTVALVEKVDNDLSTVEYWNSDKMDAAYICRAVNAHDELIALLRFLVSLDDDDIDNLDSIKARAKEIIAEEKGIAC